MFHEHCLISGFYVVFNRNPTLTEINYVVCFTVCGLLCL